ncbi:radical SAM protein [bacterium]|nr:radical SAM protein [bacterium]
MMDTSFGKSFADIELNRYKFVSHIEKLKELARGGDVYPVTIELDMVDFCNHDCWWCVDPNHGNNSLSPEFVSRLLQELKSLEVKGIVYKGGGEGMLHSAFAETIRDSKDLGFEVGVVTNGSRLKTAYKAVVQSADYLRVSIDGPTEETHRRLHKSRDFLDIIEGIRQVVSYREELQNRHPIIGLSFAMDFSMLEFVRDAVEMGDDLRVDYVLLRPPFFEEVGRESSMTLEGKKELMQAFETEKATYKGTTTIMIDNWTSDTDARSGVFSGASPRRGAYSKINVNGIEHVTGRCHASPLLAVITAEGEVYPCCNLRFIKKWSLGKIDYTRGVGFAEIWQSERRKQVMEKIHKTECISHCTHPLSRYNEVIEYLRSPRYHNGFV